MLIGQDRYEQVHVVLARELERARQRHLGGFDLISRQQKNSMAKPRSDSRRGAFVLGSNFFCPRLRRRSSFVVAERGFADTDHHTAKQSSLRRAPAGWRLSAFEAEPTKRSLQYLIRVYILSSHKARLTQSVLCICQPSRFATLGRFTHR